MNEREWEALYDAYEHQGWAFWKGQTTRRLAERGWFGKREHPLYGLQWHITDAGRDAFEAERKRRLG